MYSIIRLVVAVTVVVAVAFAGLTAASPVSPRAAGCTGVITSLDDVAKAVKCTKVQIKGFEVPPGKVFELDLLQGTTVDMQGDIKFGVKNWKSHLFIVRGNDITFNGNDHTFDGQGGEYWDGKGLQSTKPDPMMRVKISGIFRDVKVINSPARAYSVSGTPGPLHMTSLTVDNSAADAPNSKSGGKPAGHNTDGIFVAADHVMISNSFVHNQDDCAAITDGNNITFKESTCIGLGHGIAIGSIPTGASVSNVHIINNKIIDSDQALRIKTMADAKSASVSNVTFSGNIATGCKKFGILIDQGYPTTLGEAGNGVSLKDISFTGDVSTISVEDSAVSFAINCGANCSGKWNWEALRINGGKKSIMRGFNGIIGYNS